jgi:hypothetical protein
MREIVFPIKFRLCRQTCLASEDSPRKAPGFVPGDKSFRRRHGNQKLDTIFTILNFCIAFGELNLFFLPALPCDDAHLSDGNTKAFNRTDDLLIQQRFQQRAHTASTRALPINSFARVAVL